MDKLPLLDEWSPILILSFHLSNIVWQPNKVADEINAITAYGPNLLKDI